MLPADSLRILQHVDSVRAPSAWDPSESRSWNEIQWEEKLLKVRVHHSPAFRLFQILELVKVL